MINQDQVENYVQKQLGEFLAAAANHLTMIQLGTETGANVKQKDVDKVKVRMRELAKRHYEKAAEAATRFVKRRADRAAKANTET